MFSTSEQVDVVTKKCNQNIQHKKNTLIFEL